MKDSVISILPALAPSRPARSLVCFPFKEELSSVILRNIRAAASHPSVAEVLAVGFSSTASPTWAAVAAEKSAIETATATRITLRLQSRLGTRRPGKGDGMNTAIAYFLDNPSLARLHFFDADITTFSAAWVARAEAGADLGYGVVRHFFPRAPTDAMVTWFITRVGFARLWPRSSLPHLSQPLGGELLLTRAAARVLLNDARVTARSDWGVDTLYTFALAQAGVRVLEVWAEEGKAHALYGRLADLRTMVVECFDAVQSLKGERVREDGLHATLGAGEVSREIRESLGFDVGASMGVLKEGWTARQKKLCRTLLPEGVGEEMVKNVKWPNFGFMSEEVWVEVYGVLLDQFEVGDEDWKEILFKAWVARVLNHTLENCTRGYERATVSLQCYVERVQHKFALIGRDGESGEMESDIALTDEVQLCTAMAC